MERNTFESQVQRRILRRPEVETRTGFKRAHIYSLMKRGLFPKAVPIGARAVGWDSYAIDAWIEHRVSGNPSSRNLAGGAL
ncbi:MULTISPECIES: AlpA family transcriptional regulator [unclassified Pseudomonas]|uniref:AlpA family transcriptional regulator n=1 Tax=unclassified Pseudomonas TaxID=196821 RepID=UPI0025D824E2|nr:MULTISPECIES: AlpA family transcriptional regulator [unclassified Pseudomonas]